MTHRLLDLDSTQITKRDLRLNKMLDETKGLTEIRHNTILIPDKFEGYQDEDYIEDITSSEVTVVDDMVKVNDILKEVMKLDTRSSLPG